jgi:PAS domain S-box-containing protein
MPIFGIRFRLLAIAALAFLPPALVCFHLTLTMWDDAVAGVRRSLVESAYDSALREARNTVSLLADRREIQAALALGGSRCNEILVGLLQRLNAVRPIFTNIVLSSLRDGVSLCAAERGDDRIEFGAENWFQRVVDNGTFEIGGYRIGRLTHRPIAITAALVRDARGEPAAVLVVPLHIEEMTNRPGATAWPGQTITVFNRSGEILLQHPQTNFVGQMLPHSSVVEVLKGIDNAGTSEGIGLDGTQRVSAIHRLPGGSDTFVAVSVPIDDVLAPGRHLALLQFTILLCAFLAAVLGVWLVGDRLILSGVKALSRAARSILDGDLTARTSLRSRDELQDLGDTFNKMAGSLERRNLDLEHQRRALVETTAQLQGIIDASPVAIITLDPEYRVLTWGQSAERIFGYPSQEVVGKLYPLVPEGCWEEFERLCRRVVVSGENVRDISVGRRRKDGRVLDIVFSGAPLYDAERRLIGGVYALEDVTGRKRVEENLRQIEEHFRLFVENVKDHAILMMDATGYLTTWNAAAERLKGYSADEIIGEHFSIFFTGDDREKGRPAEELEQAAINGQHEVDGWRVRKDGSKFWANVTITALRDDAGSLRGFAKITRDFTERRKADEAQSLIGRIFATSLDLILVVNQKGDFIQASPSSLALLGYAPEEMVGHTATAFIYPEDLESTRNEMRLARRGRVTRNFDCRYVHKDGRIVTLAWTGIWSEPEQQHFFIGRDMTERLAADERLRRSQKLEAVGQLTGGLAHDFNNLLGIVIGNLDLIQDELSKDSTAQELIDAAMDACLRGAQLNRSLLAFARRQDLQPQRVDVGAVVRDLGTMLQRIIGERIELEVAAVDGVWPICVDPAQLESAILNLAVNARDAMPNGGRLVLEASNAILDASYAADNNDVTPGDYAMIAISDTGTGMTSEILAHVFEPFFTTKEVGQGTGLGLSMVHGFIKQSRGHVKIYSELGRGTTVRIYLPRDHTSAGESEAVGQAGNEKHVGSETILVVEDNDALRRIAVTKLSKLGYNVIEAASATAALRAIDNGAVPDLLFTDVVMPGPLDGLGLAWEAVKRVSGLKVLLTSGFTERSAGRNDSPVPWPLLSKPYRSAELGQALRTTLARPQKVTARE